MHLIYKLKKLKNIRKIKRNNRNVSFRASTSVYDYKQLIKYYNELGHDNYGNKKPSVCWNYVMNGKCNHLQINSLEKRIKLNNLWHPDKEEKIFKKKEKWKTINH